MGQTIYIIDGHSQIYRAYYAPFRDLTSPTGEPTRATYVFVSMLLKLIRDKRPTLLAMAIDGPTSSHSRSAIFADYKATRSTMPDDLPVQVNRILQIVRAMNIPLLEAPRYEADDVIATLAHRYAGPHDVVAVSRDKDLDQIIGPHVRMYDPMKDQTIDAASVLAEKGYTPDKAVEVQTLMGDAIDNIPGIPGVGPKTAARLIMQYGTAENVVAHAEELSPKLRQNVLEHAGRLGVARQLVTLDCNVPIETPLEGMRFPGLSTAVLRPIFIELGFNRLLDQLDQIEQAGMAAPGTPVVASSAQGHAATAVAPSAPTIPPSATTRPKARPQPIPGGLFAQEAPQAPHTAACQIVSEPTVADQSAGVGESAIHPPSPDSGYGVTGNPQSAIASLGPKYSSAIDFTYTCITTVAQLEALAKELVGVTRLSVDTETTCPQPMWCELVGISLSWKPGEAVYIPLKGPTGATVLPIEDVRRLIGPVLADPNVEKVGQNLKYDMISLATADLRLHGKLFDTMIAAHVLDSTRMTYNLGALSAEYLAHKCIPIEDLIGRGKKQITMDCVPCDQVAIYAAEDADVAFRLADFFRQRLADEGLTGLFEDLEMPLLPVLAGMETQGIIIDPAVLKHMEIELSAQADKLRERIMLSAGRPFNVDSPRQLAVVLFDELKLPVGRKTQTGASTDSDVLEQLAVLHELPGLVLDYRKLTKLIGTYLKALAKCIHPRTGRVHTDFHQTGAATGRLSSSDPNLQNIPIRTEEGRRIRAAFVARPGWRLLSADYSQVELRVLAHFCQDPTLIEAFATDQDIHRIVAAEVFGVPLLEVTSEQRSRAKTVNFGIIYGQTAYGLSVTLRIPRRDAQDFIWRYRQRFPRIEEFLQACIAMAKQNGYVETIFGRRRRIPDILTANAGKRALAERLAINSVVQGSAADLIKKAMVNIADRLCRENRPSRMLLQIHDELVFEVPQEAVEQERQMIVQEMSSAIQLRVPLKVETGVGRNWMEAK